MGNFPRALVTDDAGNPLPGAVGKFYALSDTSATTPLVVTDLFGNALTNNEIVANDLGITPGVRCPGYIAVSWVSGANRQDVQAVDIIPAAGGVGDILRKASAADFDYAWLPADTPLRDIRDFGAVVGDAAATRAAIQACFDLGGATYIPYGDWSVDGTLNVTLDGTMVIGQGAGNRDGATQPTPGCGIRAAAGFTGTEILKVQRVADDRPLAAIHIAGVNIDGDSIAATGLLLRASQSTVENVHFWQCTVSGVTVKGYASPAWDTYDTRFTNCLIGYCYDGLVMEDHSNDLHVTNCIILNNTHDGVISRSSSAQFTACHIYTSGRYNLFFDGGGSRSKFANCKFEGCGDHIVNIDSTNGGYSDIQFTGCGFSTHNQSTVTTNTKDYVIIQGTPGIGRTQFVGCNFALKGGSTIKPRYGINIASSAGQNTVIVGCSFGPTSHWGTAPYKNASASSLVHYVRGNSGLPDVFNTLAQTAAYTLVFPTDALGDPVEVNSATTVAVTVPPAADPGFMKGNVVKVAQVGAGQVTFTAGAGVTLQVPTGKTAACRGQYSQVTLRMRLTNVWVLEGDLA